MIVIIYLNMIVYMPNTYVTHIYADFRISVNAPSSHSFMKGVSTEALKITFKGRKNLRNTTHSCSQEALCYFSFGYVSFCCFLFFFPETDAT